MLNIPLVSKRWDKKITKKVGFLFWVSKLIKGISKAYYIKKNVMSMSLSLIRLSFKRPLNWGDFEK